MDLLHQFKQHWQKRAFANNNQTVLLAVSGGMDSMVMCHLMLHAGIKVAIAHCNFQLRGEESDADELFVKTFAKNAGVSFFSVRFDTAHVVAERKTGIQETARWLRYNWLEQVRNDNGFHAIATAHHANDNVETVLMNLFKGTGISGMHGIQEKNGNIIRPLLFAFRSDIQQYAKDGAISFREDASNQSDKYQRNAIRLNIMPAIEASFPDAASRINESISRLAQAEILYQRETARKIGKLKQQRGSDVYIPVLKLKKTAPLETVCYELLKPYGFTPAHIPQVMDLCEADSGRFLLSKTHKLIKDRNALIITDVKPSESDFMQVDGVPAVIKVTDGRFSFSMLQKGSINKEAGVAFIDAGKIAFPLIIRKWRLGDYFYPLGMGMKKKKLSRFFIDQKLPLHEKEKVWVLECNKKVVWVCGMRLDERFKITDTTSEMLKVEFRMQ